METSYLPPFTLSSIHLLGFILLSPGSLFPLFLLEEWFAEHDPEHVTPEAELHAPNLVGEKEGTEHESRDDNKSPQVVIDLLKY